MATVVFTLEGKPLTIQCLKTEKMKDICNRFSLKIDKSINSLLFLYGGAQVNYEFTFNEQANSIDKKKNQMMILVYEQKEEDGLKCPNCGKPINLDLLNKIINNNQNDMLKELKIQLENIINLNDMIKIKNQIKIVKFALDNVIIESEQNINDIKNSINNNNNKKENENQKISYLMKKLEMKDNEIKALKSNNSVYLNPGEVLMPVIFTSADGRFYYSLICKNTDKFNIIENKLYEIYPEYLETVNSFLCKGNLINKAKTFQQNKINYSDIILLLPQEI